MHAGQAIVQFARDDSNLEYAVKFFVSIWADRAATEIYTDASNFSTTTIDLPITETLMDFVVSYASFSLGADFLLSL